MVCLAGTCDDVRVHQSRWALHSRPAGGTALVTVLLGGGQRPKGHFPEATQRALLAQVQAIIPQDAQLTFLGDGELDCVDVQADLRKTNWHYLCRTASTIRVRAYGVQFHVGDLGPPRGERLAVTPAWMTAAQYGPVSILALWELPFKEPI